MLLASLDGIEPGWAGEPSTRTLQLGPGLPGASMPGSLEDALDALEADHDFLLKGDVFTKDTIETWISYKRSKEVDALRLRPHPYEFFLYYDI
jgi:glutamine synthetase